MPKKILRKEDQTEEEKLQAQRQVTLDIQKLIKKRKKEMSRS